jgi:hypothetical protein
MIEFQCPFCSKRYNVRDEHSGKQTTCPNCQTKLRVPEITASAVKLPDRSINRSYKAKQPPQRVEPQKAYCPFCEAEISLTAKKCRHCGETVDVALRAAEEARRTTERGPTVFMNSAAAAAVNVIHHRGPRSSPGTAAVLEIIFGLFLCTFGIGHIYAGSTVGGVLIMFFGWFLLLVTVLSLFSLGCFTLPLWLFMLILSPALAASSCR